MGQTTLLAGDYNGNGQVEQADLDLVLLHWGAAVSTLPATWTNFRPTEGIVDQVELDGVLLNWGNIAPVGSAGAVPEPSTFLLIALLVTAATFWHGRRRK